MSPASLLNEVNIFDVKNEIYFFFVTQVYFLFKVWMFPSMLLLFFDLGTPLGTNVLAIWSFRGKNAFKKFFSDPYLALRCAEDT